jgi:site-specific recombinase XerD
MSQTMPEGPNLPPESGNSPTAVQSMPVTQWPAADRLAWAIACRPAERLKRGGAASHMKDITRKDLARRYGYFLDHIQRTEGLDPGAGAATLVSPERVERYLTELQVRVGSVTVHGSIYKLRRMAQVLAANRDFTWLTEIEKDLALVMQPKSKFNRYVYTNVAVEAGMTLMAEADAAMNCSALARARQLRNGLMVALLALYPIRLKNFAALEIGRTFAQVNERWWIVLTASDTKERRPDERPVESYLTSWINRYIVTHRPVLARTDGACGSLWVSSNDGRPMTYSAVEKVISQTTLATVGIDISPHLFRTAGASSCAVYAGDHPHLASALLHHMDPRVTEEHYNRATSMSAAQSYASLIRRFREGEHEEAGRTDVDAI